MVAGTGSRLVTFLSTQGAEREQEVGKAISPKAAPSDTSSSKFLPPKGPITSPGTTS